jgi:hypothetical protein
MHPSMFYKLNIKSNKSVLPFTFLST